MDLVLQEEVADRINDGGYCVQLLKLFRRKAEAWKRIVRPGIIWSTNLELRNYQGNNIADTHVLSVWHLIEIWRCAKTCDK